MPNLMQATALRDEHGAGRFSIDLDANWTANGHCTAGYLASVVTRAVLQDARAPFPAVVAVDARYLRVTSPGLAIVEVVPLHVGAGSAHWQVTLTAGDGVGVAALITTGSESTPDKTAPPPALPAQDDCVLLPSQAPGFDLPVMEVMRQYADPVGLGWLAGTPSGQGVAQGWVRFADGATPPVLSLVAALDSFPTATYDRGLEGWAATVDLSAHVLGSPALGPLRLRRRVHETAGSLVTLTYDVWDAASSLVATGMQLCSLRS